MNDPHVPNYIRGRWQSAETGETLPVVNPGTGDILASVPLSTTAEVGQAVAGARTAFPDWRKTPASDRIQYLFRFKALLEERFEEIAITITRECGKTLGESRGELRRGIENVEVATGIPLMMQGYNSEDIARGIDEIMIRQPLGVVAAITPFNFPGMIPLWFLPYAIACGNTFVLKPSEKVPLTMRLIFELIDALDLPPGVVSLVNGAAEAATALIDHPDVRAISFVGSSAVARQVYARAARAGKRAQCQGGAKNAVVVMPDADLDTTTHIVADSAFGCAGQRCLATATAILVGEARPRFRESLSQSAHSRKVGYGLDAETEMGPVISGRSRDRIEQSIEQAVRQGARILVDGRNPEMREYEAGSFMRPSLLEGVDPKTEIAQTEVFGPVLSLQESDSLDSAIARLNSSPYGNMACIFTSSGSSARKFRHEVEAGNIGVNVGVAAPMAFFPFSGWKESFFGDLHGQGRDAIEFYTDKKVVVERWPREWSRRF